MILMRFRHLLQVGVAATVLTLGITSMASAQSAQRPPAGKPAAKPAAAAPAAKPGTPAAAAQKPAANREARFWQACARQARGGGAERRPGRGSRDPAGLVRGLGRLHGPVRPDQDLLRPDPAQGPAAQDGNPRPGLPVRVLPPRGERQERGSLRDGLHRPRTTARRRPRSAPPIYVLLTKEANAWLKNPAEEGQAIATMSRSGA